MPQLPTTSYAVLGLLSIAPMSGYELARAAEQSIANFWPIAKSQVYSELSRLEDLGYVQGSDIRQQRLPDKRIFEPTDVGTKVLDEWLASPEYETERYRSGFLVKFFFADRMPDEVLMKMLKDCRDSAASTLKMFEQLIASMAGNPDAFFRMQTASFGRKHIQANHQWAQDVLTQLDPSSKPKKATARKTATDRRKKGHKDE